ncbi:uncharacterized protein [Haliotis asinina]|uniref:uncharacterized protein n=1 Tax=Haliotis asinina TaxID=109174 RepID=UPI003531EB8B
MVDLAAKAALNKSVTPVLIPYTDYKPNITCYIRGLMQKKWDTQITDILKKSKPQKPNIITKTEREALKDLRNDDSITIVPADKGKAIIILNTPDFESVVHKILDDTTTYRQLQNDPTQKLQRQHKAHLKKLR